MCQTDDNWRKKYSENSKAPNLIIVVMTFYEVVIAKNFPATLFKTHVCDFYGLV